MGPTASRWNPVHKNPELVKQLDEMYQKLRKELTKDDSYICEALCDKDGTVWFTGGTMEVAMEAAHVKS